MNANWASGVLYLAGKSAAFPAESVRNFGLYRVRRSIPGLIQPDRCSDRAPISNEVIVEPVESRKSRVVNRRDGDRRNSMLTEPALKPRSGLR